MADPKLKLGNDIWATKQKSLLAYNDEGGNFKSLPFQVDRISGGTYVGRNGLIQYAASNEPRIDFLNNPKGHLLLEPQRTNLVTYSEDFSGYRVASSTVTPNSTTAPDGTNSGILVTQGTSTLVLRVPNVVAPSTIYTFSGYFKSSGSVTQVKLDITDENITTFDLTNEWQRFSVTAQSKAGGSPYHFVDVDTNGSQGDTFYAWGLQVEQADYATSIIKTSGSAVTRIADACTNGGNEQVINSTEGVLYLETKPITDNYSNNGNAFSSQINLSDGNLNNGVNIRFRGTNLQCLYYNGSSYQAVLGLIDISVQNYKIAFSYKENEFKMFVNGLLVQQDLAGTIGAFTLSKITFDNSNGVNPFYGKVKDLKVYDTALSDSELQALTTI